MSNFRPWAFWRRVQYGGGFLAFWLVVFSGVYFVYFYTPSSCFDGEQNNGETGVDCGGGCVRICAADVFPPQLQWAESFKIVDGQYNALAYVENRNPIASTPALEYTFTFKDEAGDVITTRSGSTILPPDSVYPIFEGRVMTGGREIASTELTLEPAELWLPATIGRDQFVSSAINLTSVDESPRLSASVDNTALTEAKDVEFVTTIFSRDGQPLTASQTYVDVFAPRSREEVVFTWPRPIAKTLRSCDVPTDAVIAIDLSGSMNNDAPNPPQPITAVLNAAGTFASQFRAADQLAVVTFASNAALREQLTRGADRVVPAIRRLTIDPAEEAGSTNTADALSVALRELESARHSTEARKVVVLLTDGLATAPDPNPEAAALAAATALKDAGVEVYTIGLGNEVNMTFLRQVADEPAQAYQAVSTADLTRIYSEITTSICEEGPARIDIIPKTDANFTPLR